MKKFSYSVKNCERKLNRLIDKKLSNLDSILKRKLIIVQAAIEKRNVYKKLLNLVKNQGKKLTFYIKELIQARLLY